MLCLVLKNEPKVKYDSSVHLCDLINGSNGYQH